MIKEPSDSGQLLAVIRGWFRLLAADRWDEADGILDEPNSDGVVWTPAYIRRTLDLAYGPGCRFRIQHPEGPKFSDPDAAWGKSHGDVWAFSDGSGYGAVHNAPLNGAWSDLAAHFEFLPRPGGLAVGLHDLHVF